MYIASLSLLEVDYALVIICRSIIAKEVHESCRNRRNSKTLVELCAVLAVVAWIVSDAWYEVE